MPWRVARSSSEIVGALGDPHCSTVRIKLQVLRQHALELNKGLLKPNLYRLLLGEVRVRFA